MEHNSSDESHSLHWYNDRDKTVDKLINPQDNIDDDVRYNYDVRNLPEPLNDVTWGIDAYY